MFQHKRIAEILLTAFLTVCLAVPAFAQSAGVSGKVTDKSGEPVVGAFVQEKGTNNGSVTDIDGNYSIKTGKNATLVFQSLGYVKSEVPVNGQAIVNAVLLDDVTMLEEAVAIGYGTLEKKLLTSSVSSVSGESILPGQGDASVAAALRGKIANLQVNVTDSPNAEAELQLRGVASYNAKQDPLIVIDGMAGGDLDSILPEDILSVDVLKDAAAGAIYGSRAAGGVILVTTKSASRMKKGTTSITYTAEASHRTDISHIDYWDRDFYLNVWGKKYNVIDYGADTNWYEEITNKKNFSQKHTLNFQANSDVCSVYATLQYNDVQGLAKFDERKDITGRLNADFHLLNGWLDINTRFEYRETTRDNNALDYAGVFINPTRPVYDETAEDGYAYDDTSNYNIVREREKSRNESYVRWLMPEISLKLNILPIEGLYFKQDFAMERRQNENFHFNQFDAASELSQNRNGYASIQNKQCESYNVEGYFNYSKRFDKHNVNAVAGYSYYYDLGTYYYDMYNYDFENQKAKYWDMQSGSWLYDGKAGMSSGRDATSKLLSFYGRVNYDYDSKYILSASIRREGISGLPKAHRWGTFWSVSGGWRISSEPWMQGAKDWLSDLKIRASYGVTGNGCFGVSAVNYGTGEYQFMNPGTGKYGNSYEYDDDPNYDLKWEEQHGYNFGIDYAFFDNRLFGKLDLYYRNVKDMIYNIGVPCPPNISSSKTVNVGGLTNRGFEFEIGADIVRTQNVRYTVAFRSNRDITKIGTLDGKGKYDEKCMLDGMDAGTGFIRIAEGTTIGQFYMWEYSRIDKDLKEFIFIDRNGNEILAANCIDDDRRAIGNYVPKAQISMDNRLSVYNWEFGIDLRSWIKFDVFNTWKFNHGFPYQGGLKSALTGPDAEYLENASRYPSNYFFEDGTFLKIDAINIAYNFPMKKWTNNFVKGLKLYVTGNNVATFTKYTGMDPEIGLTGFKGGFDGYKGGPSFYPRTRTMILGLQLKF